MDTTVLLVAAGSVAGLLLVLISMRKRDRGEK